MIDPVTKKTRENIDKIYEPINAGRRPKPYEAPIVVPEETAFDAIKQARAIMNRLSKKYNLK